MILDGGQRRQAGPLGFGPRACLGAVVALLMTFAPVTIAGRTPMAVAGEAHTSKRADKRAEAKAEFEKAQLHYRLGRFEEALKSYTRAYELFNAPALLFNIGQCHKNLQNHERAIFFFEGYLREETNAEKRALAEELIAVSRAQLERQRSERAKADIAAAAAASAPVTPPPPPEPPAPAAGGAATAPPSAIVEVEAPPAAPVLIDSPGDAPPPADEQPVYQKWWFWTALGTGAALAAGAAIYYATGPTLTLLPKGTAGTLDRRQ